MDSFQAIIGWKRKRNRENKKFSFRFVPTRCVIENSIKIRKNLKKIKKYHYGFISFRFIPTRRVIENIKKIAKKFKNTIMDTFQAKIGWNSPRKRKNKNYRSVPFLPDP